MAKTNPIGVRFDEDLLIEVKGLKVGADTPQGVLSFYESFYRMSKAANGKKENKKEQSESNNSNSGNVFDFGDDIFLNVEKYTKYPKNKRPTGTIGEQIDWDKNKAEYDLLIRQEWHKHKNK